MPPVSVHVDEQELVKVVLEFLETRNLHIAQLALERESGIINGGYSDDTLFVRQLIIDGQWDSAVDFVEPLRSIAAFDFAAFKYLILKYKFYELLCIRMEPGPMHDNEFTIEEMVETLKELETFCPSKEEYKKLCALVTLPSLMDHGDFKHWNPSSARVECFQKIHPLIQSFLAPPNPPSQTQNVGSSNDRLMQLVAKGLFYESCVDTCQSKAVKPQEESEPAPALSNQLPRVLDCRAKLSSTDLSLLCWIETVSLEQFALPFEQRSLDLRYEKMHKPQLEANWTEHILATPVKPANQFPYAAVPNQKLKSAEKMSRSMMGGLAGMQQSSAFMASQYQNPHAHMSQSTANVGFHIRTAAPTQMQTSGVAQMQQSVIDQMFETNELSRSSLGTSQIRQQPYAVPNGPPTAPMAPLAHAPSDSARQQLEDISRRAGAGMGGLAAVPENQALDELQSGPLNMQGANGTADGQRLLHEFNRQQRQQNPQVMDAVNYQMMQLSTVGTPGSSLPPPSLYNSQMSTPEHRAPDNGLVQESPYARPHVPPQPLHQPPPNDYAPRQRQQSNNFYQQFNAVCRMEDSQAIRAVSFHPSGRYFAVGTNSKQLHIVKYPDLKRWREEQATRAAEIALTRPRQHRGSVYCVGFNPTGELLATGSNDKSVRLMGFNAESCKIGAELELNMHDGTVRDLVFIEDTTNRSSLLITAGAGNCQIHVTDCQSAQTIRSYQGHTAPNLGLYAWSSCTFASCSQDKTIRFWDLRSPQAVNLIAPGPRTASAPVCSVCVDPGGRLLVSGHEDASVMLYDLTANKVIQIFRPHGDEVRTVRFSPGTYYLLSGSYDKKIALTDMRRDLMAPMMYLPVAEHHDKVIQCRWHPHDFSFLSTSADRSAVLWALPPPANNA